MASGDKCKIIIAANRYVEGGRRPHDLKKLAELIANASTEEELEERLRLATGKPASKKS